MNISEIANIVLAVLTLIVGLIATYYKGHNALVSKVAGYVALAEETYTDAKTGGLKMQYVVGRLYALLPAAVRPFILQSVIQTIVQAIFNQIDAFARQQLDKAAAAAVSGSDKIIGTVPDNAAATTTATGSAEASQTQQVTAGLSGTAAK